jgi:hypothetical protein
MNRFFSDFDLGAEFVNPLRGNAENAAALSSMEPRRFERVMSDRVPLEEAGPHCPRERA